jgi:hypothetical protein
VDAFFDKVTVNADDKALKSTPPPAQSPISPKIEG